MIDEAYAELPEKSGFGPLIDKSIGQSLWKLRFAEPLETLYQNHIARQKWLQTNIVGGICLLIFNSGTLLDYHANPDGIWLSLFLRVIVGTLPCAMLFWCTRYVDSHYLRDSMTTGGLLLIGIVINLLLTLRGATAAQQAFSIALLVIVMNIVLQLPLLIAAIGTLIIHLITSIFLVVFDPPLSGSGHLGILFITVAGAITLVANYRLDMALRRLYLVLLREKLRNEEVRRENRELNTFSYTDTLTGIYNRRRLDEAMRDLWQDAHDALTPLALLIIDIDHFKRYNDTHGHPAGDICLKHVAEAVAGVIRTDKDLAARMGGEEFAVLLSDCDMAAACEVAERIHKALADTRATSSAGAFLDKVTVSIGIAVSSPAEGGTNDDFVQAADKALYQAKQSGRNQTCCELLAA